MEELTLIEISENHYVAVSLDIISIGDIVIEKLSSEEYFLSEIHTLNDIDVINQRKVIYSTEPLGCACYQRSLVFSKYCAERNNCFSKIKHFDLEKIQKLIYGYSVQDLGFKHKKAMISKGRTVMSSISGMHSYMEGFLDHKNLVKTKLFTIEDIEKAFKAGMEHSLDLTKPCAKEYINSILPPKEWLIRINEAGEIRF